MPRHRPAALPRLFLTAVRALALVAAVVACGSDDPPVAAGSLSVVVDASVAPAQARIGDRPVGRMVAESGVEMDFFLGELIVATDDRAALDAFAARWGGEVSESTQRAGDVPALHKVKLDPSAAVVERLLGELNAKAPELRGSFRSSSDDAAKLLAVALSEANQGGMTVTPNFVLSSHGFEEGTTAEAETGDGPLYSPNAFEWPYMNRGSAQDVGVGAAWRAMARAGVLRNKIKMMILDGGFSPNEEFPESRTVIGDWNVSNPGSCSGNPCPWHGTLVTSVAMGTADNGVGGAGPAAPVAELVAVPFQLDFFQLLASIERILVGAAGADIINVSAGFELDVGFDVAMKIACLGTCASPSEMASGIMALISASNKLIFASAGNAGRDVDGRSTPEGSTIIPCELATVICVGGMAHDSTALFLDERGGSNFGTRTDDDSVDIYGPFWAWVGPDPDNPASHARLRSGTSYSSPFVAGVAALVWASDRSQSASQVWQVIRETAHVGGVHAMGGHQRRINAFGAVARALRGGAPPTVVLNAAPAAARLNRETTVTATVTDDGAPCPPPRCPLTWEPAPARVVGNSAVYLWDSVGAKTVTVTSEDPIGQRATASRTFDVVNVAPVVTIVAPAAGASVPLGVGLQLLGSAIDENEGPGPRPGPLACRWTSSNLADPFPVTGCDVIRSFSSQGARTLTLSATDAQGMTSTTSVAITVTAPPVNHPPTVQLTTTLPAVDYDGSGYKWTTSFPIAASATDPEDDVPITFEWRATSYRPNSTTVYASDVTLASSASFAWTPSSTEALFGSFAELGNDCYSGQIVRISVRATDNLGNTSAPRSLPDLRIYRCTLD